MKGKQDSEPASSRHAVRRSRLWVPLFMMVGISLLSGSAGVQMGPLSFTGIDKLGHLVVFGLLGIAWARCLSASAWSRRRRLLAATLLTTGFGLLDELHQFTNPQRYFEWADLAADFAGALFATAAYLWIGPLQALLEVNFKGAGRLMSDLKRANSVE
jgi:VanZ family protein